MHLRDCHNNFGLGATTLWCMHTIIHKQTSIFALKSLWGGFALVSLSRKLECLCCRFPNLARIASIDDPWTSAPSSSPVRARVCFVSCSKWCGVVSANTRLIRWALLRSPTIFFSFSSGISLAPPLFTSPPDLWLPLTSLYTKQEAPSPTRKKKTYRYGSLTTENCASCADVRKEQGTDGPGQTMQEHFAHLHLRVAKKRIACKSLPETLKHGSSSTVHDSRPAPSRATRAFGFPGCAESGPGQAPGALIKSPNKKKSV
jgi:hypothetical protein